MYGDRIEFIDYLREIGLPSRYYREAHEYFTCPNCGTPLSLFLDVGIKTQYEKEFEARLGTIDSRIVPLVEEFSGFLSDYPYLGAKHRTGKRIGREIDDFGLSTIQDEDWFRARSIGKSRIFGIEDMLPPDPEEVQIGEGRFNHHGQSCYYLGSSKKLCALEIACGHGNMCWMQTVKIKSADRILDLSRSIDFDYVTTMPLIFAGIMLSGAIRKRVLKDKSWKPEYFVSRYISDICRERGINGIKYDSAITVGENLALFNMEAITYELTAAPSIYQSTSEVDISF